MNRKDILEMAAAQIEWDYPLDYQILFEKLIKGEPVNRKCLKYIREEVDWIHPSIGPTLDKILEEKNEER